jgi:hypothetical protein
MFLFQLNICLYFIRLAQQQFTHHVIQRLHETIKKPVKMCIGSGNKMVIRDVLVLCSNSCNDNDEQYPLTNCNFKNKHRRCRVCTWTLQDFLNYDHHVEEIPLLRDAKYLHDLSKRYQPIFEKIMNTGFNSRCNITNQEKAITKSFHKSGLLPGINILHEDYLYFTSNGLGDVWSTAFIDLLHTFFKGPIELMFKFSVTAAYLMNGKDMSLLYLLDERIKAAPYKQSLAPFGEPYTFPEGITGFFKNNERNPKAMETSSMSSGCIEAQRMPSLLFWFGHAIGTQGDIIPNRYVPICRCNPTEAILKGVSCCLDLCWMLRCPTLKEFDDTLLHGKLCEMEAHIKVRSTPYRYNIIKIHILKIYANHLNFRKC